MKSAVILFLMALSVGCMAQNPLKPLNPDSVMLDDFFWVDMVDSATTLFPKMKPQSLEITPKDVKNLPKVQESFANLEPNLFLTGCERGKKNEVKRFKSAKDVVSKTFKLALMMRDGKYFDYCEQALFNEIAGAWKDSASKTNKKDIAEVLATIPQMVYAVDGKDVYINMIVRNRTHIVTEHLDMTIHTMASMPWYGQCIISMDMEKEQEFTLYLRCPHWADGKSVMSSFDATAGSSKMDIYINGERPEKRIVNGYYVISRRWKNGDMMKLSFPYPIMRVQDRQSPSRMALQRGPLIYAFEENLNVKGVDGISNTFDGERETIFLASKKYDEQGNATGQYKAFPYCLDKEKYYPLIFAKKLK